MEQNQALQLLVAGVQKGQANGIFSLEESAALAQAVNAFRPPEEAVEEEPEEADDAEAAE
jgi:hypothetical protein|tara:strand:+ start:168 stop:347 length:180 start_codon:yes stop_codon:yes gene_type:complete